MKHSCRTKTITSITNGNNIDNNITSEACINKNEILLLSVLGNSDYFIFKF